MPRRSLPKDDRLVVIVIDREDQGFFAAASSLPHALRTRQLFFSANASMRDIQVLRDIQILRYLDTITASIALAFNSSAPKEPTALAVYLGWRRCLHGCTGHTALYWKMPIVKCLSKTPAAACKCPCLQLRICQGRSASFILRPPSFAVP